MGAKRGGKDTKKLGASPVLPLPREKFMLHLLPALSGLAPAVTNNQDNAKKPTPAYRDCKGKYAILYMLFHLTCKITWTDRAARKTASVLHEDCAISGPHAVRKIGNMNLEGFMLE